MPLWKGASPRIDDINIPGLALGPGASPPDKITILGSGNIRAYGFDGNATTEELHGSTEILHGYVEGSNISFHVHWMPTTADSGNVKWQLEYSWYNTDEVAPNPTIISVVQSTSSTAWKPLKGIFPAIDGTGKRIQSDFVFRLFRDPTDGEDTYNSHDAALLQVGFHYWTDAHGSRTTTTK